MHDQIIRTPYQPTLATLPSILLYLRHCARGSSFSHVYCSKCYSVQFLRNSSGFGSLRSNCVRRGCITQQLLCLFHSQIDGRHTVRQVTSGPALRVKRINSLSARSMFFFPFGVFLADSFCWTESYCLTAASFLAVQSIC
jgi:hypothetical protein